MTDICVAHCLAPNISSFSFPEEFHYVQMTQVAFLRLLFLRLLLLLCLLLILRLNMLLFFTTIDRAQARNSSKSFEEPFTRGKGLGNSVWSPRSLSSFFIFEPLRGY